VTNSKTWMNVSNVDEHQGQIAASIIAREITHSREPNQDALIVDPMPLMVA